MSTCPRCYEDVGCTCEEHDRIKVLEGETERLRDALEMMVELHQNELIDFDKYGLETDADILVKAKQALEQE